MSLYFVGRHSHRLSTNSHLHLRSCDPSILCRSGCAPPLLALLLTSGQSRVTHDEQSQSICPSATYKQPLASTFTHIGGFTFRPPPRKHNILLLFYSGLRANAGIIAHPTLWTAYCHAHCRYCSQLSKLNISGMLQIYGQTTKPARTTAV